MILQIPITENINDVLDEARVNKMYVRKMFPRVYQIISVDNNLLLTLITKYNLKE